MQPPCRIERVAEGDEIVLVCSSTVVQDQQPGWFA
jgi:hypothetical protein